jgi:GNAT superfamily N-acetyltransferase
VAEVPRLAVPPDQSAIEDVVRAAYEPWVEVIGTRPGPMDADYASLIAAGSVYVTGSGGAQSWLDALIVLIPEDGALLVENVAVRPDRKWRGIGRRLLAFAEDEARRRRLPAVRLYTHAWMTTNISLYESLGYNITECQSIGTAGHLVHLRKQLVADEPG